MKHRDIAQYMPDGYAMIAELFFVTLLAVINRSHV